MKVTFTKTHARGYSVTVERPGTAPSTLDPAPGYHPRLPHDAAHFIVENELGIRGGIFGQLAAGGLWSDHFVQDMRARRKGRKQSHALFKENKADALRSEHAVYAAQSRWERQPITPETDIPISDIARICERFDDFARRWSRLRVGESVVVEWRDALQASRAGKRKR